MGLWCRPRRCATVERKLQQTKVATTALAGWPKPSPSHCRQGECLAAPTSSSLQGPRATSNATSRATWNATSAPMNATSAPSARPADAQGSTHDQQQELFVL